MKPLPFLNILVLVGVVGYGLFHVSQPLIAESLWGEEYKSMMYECDHAMREHFIAKKMVEVAVSDEAVNNLKSSELGLMTCHDYDKLRKKMQQWGLSETGLSMLGLEALEEKDYELKEFVEIHEIRY